MGVFYSNSQASLISLHLGKLVKSQAWFDNMEAALKDKLDLRLSYQTVDASICVAGHVRLTQDVGGRSLLHVDSWACRDKSFRSYFAVLIAKNEFKKKW